MRTLSRILISCAVAALAVSTARAQPVVEASASQVTEGTKGLPYVITPRRLAAVSGQSAYVYIAYASDASGTGFTTTYNASLDYIAIKSTTSPIETPAAGDFTGLWFNYKGAAGDPGIDGTDGADGADGATWHRFASGTPTGGADGDFAFVVEGFEVWYRSAGTWTLQGTLAEASTLTVTGAATVGSLVFEGATADANEATLSADDPTGDNDLRLPDKGGRLVAVELADTPSDGQVPQYNTDGTITWETPSGGVTDHTTTISLFDDFVAGSTANNSFVASGSGAPWMTVTSGTGTRFGAGDAIDAGHPGIAVWGTGTTNSGRVVASIFGGGYQSVRFGGGVWTMEALVYLPALSTAVDEFIVILGFHDLTTGSDATDGAYFRYDRAALGANWHRVSAAGGTRTTTDTASAVAATTWTKLKIVVAANGSTAEFFVNGSSVGTNSTNLPTANTAFNIGLFKNGGSTGTTVSEMYLDYVHVTQTLTTPR